MTPDADDLVPRGHIQFFHGHGLPVDLYVGCRRALEARGWRTEAAPMPGYDGTPAPDQALSDEQLDAWAAADAPQPRVLVGHSLGGAVSVLLASRQPTAFDALVLVEPALVPWPWLGRRLAARYAKRVVYGEIGFVNRGPGYTRLHDPAALSPALFDAVDRCRRATPPEVGAGYVHAVTDRLPFRLDRVSMPVLWLVGGSSGALMAAAQHVISRRLPRCQKASVSGAGHWMFGEQDEVVADRIDGFLRSLGH